MSRISIITICVALMLLARQSGAQADGPWTLTIDAADYAREQVFDPEHHKLAVPADSLALIEVRTKHHLSGEGWYDYDFTVPEGGWYTISIKGGGNPGDHDFFVDGNIHIYGGVTDRITNAYLIAGKHTLRVQQLTFPGLNALPGFVIQRSDEAAANSVRVQVAGSSTILHKGDQFNLDIYSGGRTRPTELTAWVKDSATDAVQQTLHLALPAAPGLVKSRLAIPCMAEGIYYVSFGEAGKPIDPRWVRSVQFVVIDTAAHPRVGGEMKKSLLRTIDCVAQPPDFSGGGATTINHTGFGDYRESGSLGFLEDKPNYSFFSYRLDVPEAQRPYLVEVDYPDDDLRTFGIALMERQMMGYPPVGGVDSGGTMPVTNQMQTQTFIHYPRGKELVVSFVNAHNGRRAAASRIRLYQIDGSLPARLAPAAGGRSFGYWIEEGDRWTTFYGAPDKSLAGYLLSMERWAQTARYMGVDTLMPTVLIYQALLFQSTYFGGYFRAAGGPRDPMPIDALRMLLLVCEKYDLKLLPEFFPCSSEYKHTMVDNLPYAAQPDPKPNLTVNADGQIGEPPFRALYNPIFPGNQNWYVGMLGEVADTYGASPALKGVSLRCMGWCGEGWNWWSSLYWGYEDYTVHLFEKETGMVVPVSNDGPGRFRKRADWLLTNAREKWTDWRCDKITQLYARIAARIRRDRPDLLIVTPVHGNLDMTAEGNQRYNTTTDYRAMYREAGFDMTKMATVKGVMFLNALYYYGRREPDLTSQQGGRDFLLDTSDRMTFVAPQGNVGYLFSNAYFEPDEEIKPDEMGLPGVKPSGWVAAVNPAGRQYLERYALSLADSDASMLMDGGEGYLNGQPPLREFLANYRSLPAVRFVPRPDARDPVAVWELHDGKNFWFYAVNRDCVTATVTINLSGSGSVVSAATGDAAPVARNTLKLQVEPYGLLAYRCAATRRIQSIATTIPETYKAKVAAQVRWIVNAAAAIKAGTQANRLADWEKDTLQHYAADAQENLAQGHIWRARTLLENHRLLSVYEHLKQWPSDFWYGKPPETAK